MTQTRYVTLVGGPADGQKHPIQEGQLRTLAIPVWRRVPSVWLAETGPLPESLTANIETATYRLFDYTNRAGETFWIGVYEGTQPVSEPEVRYWRDRAREAEGRLLAVSGQATLVAEQVAKQVAKIGQGK